MLKPRTIILGILTIALAGCNKSAAPVHFQLPNNYVGAFRLILDSTNGINVNLENGCYTYVIPTNGVLRVKTFGAFGAWHKESAFYANGEEIPMGEPINFEISSNVIACRDTGTHGDPAPNDSWIQSIVYVIGTEAQKNDAIEKRQWRSLK